MEISFFTGIISIPLYLGSVNNHESPNAGAKASVPSVIKSLLGVGLLAASSCSLPPRESWSQVQEQGLIPVMFAGLGSTGSRNANAFTDTLAENPAEQSPSRDKKKEQLVTTTTDSHETENVEKSDAGQRSSSSGSGLASSFSGRYPTARPIPGAIGYVYSPFEEGDRAVDVSSLGKGVKARCPYSGKIFIVPDFSAPIDDRASGLASSSGSESNFQVDEKEKKELRYLASSITKSAQSKKSQVEPEPESESESESEPRLVLPEPVLPPSPIEDSSTLAEAPSDSGEKTLEGTRVAGRPGYVRSPYAGSNQLVDVTGLSPGQEVRCPYSGKLFKVPAMGEMSDVDTVEPKLPESEAPAKSESPAVEKEEDDDAPVASSNQSVPEPEVIIEDGEEDADDSKKGSPSIAKDGSAIYLSADTGGLARPVPASAPQAPPSLPVAKRIAGKKGLVRSPFGSEGQLVDVTGKSPGSQVLCPFTGKPFIVPK